MNWLILQATTMITQRTQQLHIPNLSTPRSSPTLTRSYYYFHHTSSFLSFKQAPSPSTSIDHTNSSYMDPSFSLSLSSSDHRTIRNHLHDPNWVPHLQNTFIIFCCKYSYKHAHDPSNPSKRSSHSDKMLSKCVGEKWCHLSPSRLQTCSPASTTRSLTTSGSPKCAWTLHT
jgi:hypothetical protein